MAAVKRSPKEAMPEDVQALRAALTSKLTALEEALTNPAKHSSLESLILDLARVATEEAHATARQAVLVAQRDVQSVVSTARSEAASALEAEKTTATSLREAVEKAQAELKAERRAAETAGREAAGVQRELDALRQTLEQEQSGRATIRHELEAMLASFEVERTRAAGLEQTVERLRGEAQGERAAVDAQQREIAAKLQEFAGRHQALEQQLKDAQSAHASARHDAQEARSAADAERASAIQLLETSAQLERDFEAAQSELAAVRRELDGVRLDADARTQTLSQSQFEQEQVLRAAQDAARAAEARAEEAGRERDAVRKELELAEAAILERDALRHELELAHEQRDAAGAVQVVPELTALGEDEETVVDLTTDTRDEEMQRAIEARVRSLELALRDAETRAESAELELELERERLRAAARAGASTPEEAAPEASAVPGAPLAKEPAFRGPARGAKRVAISSQVDIQIDGTEGKLIDLSVTGAQVLTPSSMKPNRLVKVTLPMGDSMIACKAKVMWSRLEPKSGQLWYRAGVSFTGADQFALEAFLKSHRKDA